MEQLRSKPGGERMIARLRPLSCSLYRRMTTTVTDAASAKEAWQALKDLYGRETVNTTINLLKNVAERKLADGASLQDHLTGFHNDWIRLKDRSLQGKGDFQKPCKHLPTASNEAKAQGRQSKMVWEAFVEPSNPIWQWYPVKQSSILQPVSRIMEPHLVPFWQQFLRI